MSQFLANLPWVLSLIYLVLFLGVATLLQPFGVEFRIYYSPMATTWTILITLLEALAVFFLWRHSASPWSVFAAVSLWIVMLLQIIYALMRNGTFVRTSRSRIALSMLSSWAMLGAALLMTFDT